MNVTLVSLYFCSWALFTTDIPVQVTSKVGSAGMYLEDYFEDQLKQIYPDKFFPGGREEQMIPPLEDEIDEDEEEMAVDGTASLDDAKAQSPAGQEIPPAEEDSPHQEEETPKTRNHIDVNDKGTGTETKVESAFIPVDEENTPDKPPDGSAASDSDTKDRESSSLEENSTRIPGEQAAEVADAQEEQSSSKEA